MTFDTGHTAIAPLIDDVLNRQNEMANGTGKTLTAAVIKLFLPTSNARRVLFLVDRRLALEVQANKAFIALLNNDYQSAI